jgi:hypothetical protein
LKVRKDQPRLRALIAAGALQVTQDERRPPAFRQALEFFVEDREQFASRYLGERVRRGPLARLLLPLAAQVVTSPRLERGVIGDLVKPTAQRSTPGNGGGLASEDQKGRLEDVLGVVPVVQDPPAHAEHQGAVAAHEGLEGRFLPLRAEAFEQLLIGKLIGLLGRDQIADMLQDRRSRCACHVRDPRQIS